MSFSNNFSLSLELSKIVPLAPIVNVASKHLLAVVRNLQNSGSDWITEHDLGAIFGRCYINPPFLRTFRNVVQHSNIYQMAGIAELILEIGAGPTVKQALDNAALFSMIVQISLLVWAHRTTSLALSLATALECRASAEDSNIPRYDALLGTLRCISQQTCGFTWELQFAAVDEKLKDALRLDETCLQRPIAHVVLRSLLDALPAVQRFPESHFLSLRTVAGVSTIVIWAHQVLGLTVEVRSETYSVKFGDGPARVLIDCGTIHSRARDEVTLLSETQDVVFHASTNWLEDPQLEPANIHPMEGYGSKIVNAYFEDQSVGRLLVIQIMKSCFQIIQEVSNFQAQSRVDVTNNYVVPTKESIISIGKILFPAYFILSSEVEAIMDEVCLARAEWDLESVRQITVPFEMESKTHEHMVKYLRITFKRLCVIILAMTRIGNVEDCRKAPLSTNMLPMAEFRTVRLTTVKEAFALLALLFLGKAPDQTDFDRAVVISHRGWSLCIGSIRASDPGDVFTDLALIQGVPSRLGERKDWIMDAGNNVTWDSDLELGAVCEAHKIVASETEQVSVKSFLPLSTSKHMIGTTTVSGRKAFVVFNIFSCMERVDGPSAYIREGFRYMQDLFWEACLVPACEHSFQANDQITVPPAVWVFKGLLGHLGSDRSDGLAGKLYRHKSCKPGASGTGPREVAPAKLPQPNEAPESAAATSRPSEQPLSSRSTVDRGLLDFIAEGRRQVHISQSAKNSAVRWILLGNFRTFHRGHTLSVFAAFYLRHDACCVDCAIAFVKERGREGFEHVGLIA
ncbi:hypothetical protein MMC26_000852 [Xylographa opegraphella]|nr:hypothetical protein [Xylographa opegraphella]